MHHRSAIFGFIALSVLCGCGSRVSPTVIPESGATNVTPHTAHVKSAAELEWEKKVEYHKLTPAQIKQALDWIKKLGPRTKHGAFVGTPASEIQEYLNLSDYVLHLDDETVYGFYLSDRPRDPNNPEGAQMQFYIDKKTCKVTRSGILSIEW